MKKTTENIIEQENWYVVIDSMGKRTNKYIIASNINDAYKKAKEDKEIKGAYWKLKRCYNGGVRG